MPANPLSPRSKKRRRSPIFAQREAAAQAAKENAARGSGQKVPPPPPPGAKTTKQDPKVTDKAREALETLPDAELIEKVEILIPDYDETWDRTRVITELLKAGVAG